jgi:ArsR family transcriptional regulator, arsenate/arsenite/antimonite-responsive transcriptional repressor
VGEISLSLDTEQVLQMFRECIPYLEVLSDENRQKIIMILAADKQGLNVNMITERLNISRPAISHHLKVLKQAGFVDMEKKSKENYYFLTLTQPVEMLKKLILAVELLCKTK